MSAAKLETYLKRKLAERGWAGAGEPPVGDLVARFVQAGYVDDAAYARMKAGSLRRRGYGERRIGQALDAAGIAAEERQSVTGSEASQRAAALAFARRRRLGPFAVAAAGGMDRAVQRAAREKQLAALLRAGHRADHARDVLDAADPQAAEAWVAEGGELENDA
ncbi:RecX family transcriptional regulator [Novosphingobium piscinae]|uniref:RecX family transcriptional regulator n=1 Tax=Novosphingobium piscinae TaxID=1507448 RepID=UPI0031B58466